ncbi:MAG: nucleotidyl transferase AbiEii/AbiGii toxin family protein, partial [Azospirillum sp.]|nr:nucleotidyl transferase AbiEii/AbiGii toxin family protein [Azospirillum sp.]
DLDFSADPNHPSIESLKKRIRSAISSFKAQSPEYAAFTVTEPKMTDTTMRWKINGKIGGEDVSFKIEISRRAALPGNHIERKVWSPDFAPGVVVAVDIYDGPAMIASKIAALVSDARNAPRDVYDIWIMGRMRFELTSDLRENLLSVEPDIVRKAWQKIDGMTYSQAKTELLPYLSENMRTKFDEGMWDSIRLQATENVERWIKRPETGLGKEPRVKEDENDREPRRAQVKP